MQKYKLGFVGLGTMGLPMAGHLLGLTGELAVYNRNPDKADELIERGAKLYDSPAELLKACDIVFIMVSDDQATSSLFEAQNGFLQAGLTRRILVNMSTVSPAISRKMNELCLLQGNDYVDAPVSGSLKQAIEAQLVIMVGAKKEIYEQIVPFLNVMGKMSLHLGQVGQGNAAKLAVNTLLAIQTQGFAETISFAEQLGIETADFCTIINNGAMANALLKIKGEALLNKNFKPAFALKHLAKDLRLAKDEGLSAPLSEIALQRFNEAALILGEEDIIAIVKT